MRKVLLGILIYFFCAAFAICQSTWKEFYNQSLNYLYNCEFEKAIECLEQAKELNPDEPSIYWRITSAIWFRAGYEKYSKEDIEKLEKAFNEALDKVSTLCNPNSTNPENLFYLGGTYGNRVFLRQALGQGNTSMLKDAGTSREYLDKIGETGNFYYEACGYLGMFNYAPILMSTIQKIKAKIAGYKWNEDEGLKQIKSAMERSQYSDDIKFLYKGILMELAKKKDYQDRVFEALSLVEELLNKYPNNYLLKQDLEALNKILEK